MTFSHGARLLLKEIAMFSPKDMIAIYPMLIQQAKHKGRKTVYPCDFKSVKIRFDATHEKTSKKLFVYVQNGKIRDAIEELAYLVKLEDSVAQRVIA